MRIATRGRSCGPDICGSTGPNSTPAVTEQTFARMTERRDGCFGLAAEAEDGTVVGFAHCVMHPTTWSRGGTCYLEDLYVDPDHRGTDAGAGADRGSG